MSLAVLSPQAEFETRKRFTRDEFRRMLDLDLFEGRRYELIDGDLIDKMGQNPRHASAIQLLLEWLGVLFGLARTRVQLPIEITGPDGPRNEPEPDLAILSETKPDFKTRHPHGDELLLAVEVADTSLRRDAEFKRDLYARAGVPEYWILDLTARELIVHRARKQGTYTEIRIHLANEFIAPQAKPEALTTVSQLLP
jgi:Uma2 family endonuclease